MKWEYVRLENATIELLNDYGSVGCELVQVMQTMHYDTYARIYMFKRAIPELPEIVRPEPATKPTSKHILKMTDMDINEFYDAWTVRLQNLFHNHDIKTLGHLLVRTEQDMFRLRGFGKKSYREVKEVLYSKGLQLGMLKTYVEAA